LKRLALLAVTATCLIAAGPANAVRDFSSTARNIVPSGEWGGVPVPKGADRQARMYDALTPLFDDVTTRDLKRYFKSEKLGIKGQGRMKRERVPRRGVRLFRDKFNVPHIYGKTNDDVTWGAGWAVAEDRELLLEQARFNARVAVLDVPGMSALGLITQLKSFQPSAQGERELRKEVGKLRRYGKRGRRLIHDMRVYVKGVNAYYRAKNKSHRRWTILDVIALNAIKSELFGEGGGDEVDAAEFLDGLQDSLGADRGYSVWNDLRQRQDPETPVTIKGNFPYAPLPANRRGNVVIDNGSFQPVPVAGSSAAAAAANEFRPHASNVLMVAGKRSRSGHPLFVGGPQIGYFYPA
jgi:acyl-homoserine lactone acylase PvdQ